MNSSNFNQFIEDFSTINSSNTKDFERILRKHPYFQTAALFLAKSNPIQHNTQTAALRSADRRVLRSWLDEEYKREIERGKQELESKKVALEIENDENRENLDINTESINAFDKLIGTDTLTEQKSEQLESKPNEINQEIVEEILQENKEIESKKLSINNFFEEKVDIDELPKTDSEIPTSTIDSNFFEEINESKEPVFEEKVDIDELPKTDSEIPTNTIDSNFFDEINESKESVFEEKVDIDELLKTDSEIPTNTIDSNFFDEINESKEPVFEEKVDIDELLKTDSEIPTNTIDSNFFDEINESKEPVFEEKVDIDELLKTDSEIPTSTIDSNFFDEIDSDDDIFGDAQKDLDNYTFPDFEEDKDEKSKKSNEGEGSFFDDI